MKLLEKGIGQITLTQNNFKASGGEGDIYVLGGKAYKIYQDPAKAIPEAKVLELAALALPNIIKPESILLNTNSTPVGYSMRLVPDSYTLCQLFPKAFKTRNNLSLDKACQLILSMRRGMRHIHDKNVLVVDVNELNFLISKDFKTPYFIDVDSYKTKSFNPTAIMESVRDRHNKGFSELTDWFSFGIIAFNLLTGIHPYRGTYKPLAHIKDLQANLDARMMQNISVLHQDVKVPPIIENFSNLPKTWYDWFFTIFERGERVPPPQDLVERITAQVQTVVKNSSKFVVEPYLKMISNILGLHEDFIETADGLYHKDKLLNVSNTFAVFKTRQLGKPMVAYLDGRDFYTLDVQTGVVTKHVFQADEIMAYDNTVYFRYGDKLMYLEVLEVGRALISSKLVCTVMPHSTQLFSGCAIQNILGKHFITILDKPGVNQQFEAVELQNAKVIDAKYENGVLVVSAIVKNTQKHFIFRNRACRIVETSDVINFTTLANGICIYQNNDKLEIFSNNPSSSAISTVEDAFLQQDFALASNGTQALAIVGSEIVKISLKK